MRSSVVRLTMARRETASSLRDDWLHPVYEASGVYIGDGAVLVDGNALPRTGLTGELRGAPIAITSAPDPGRYQGPASIVALGVESSAKSLAPTGASGVAVGDVLTLLAYADGLLAVRNGMVTRVERGDWDLIETDFPHGLADCPRAASCPSGYLSGPLVDSRGRLVGMLLRNVDPAVPARGVVLRTPTLADLIRPLVPAWKPASTNFLLFDEANDDMCWYAPDVCVISGKRTSPLLALSARSGQATPLVMLPGLAGSLAVRDDGSAIVAVISDGWSSRTRLAIWDSLSGRARWLTPPSVPAARFPIWSPDGTVVYFSSDQAAVSRISADGTGLDVMVPKSSSSDDVRPLRVVGETLFSGSPAGLGVGWYALEARDLRTGRTVFQARCGHLTAVRSLSPRILLDEAACAISDPVPCPRCGDYLLDERTGVETQVAATGTGADWDPSGRQLVVVAPAYASRDDIGVIDERGVPLRTQPNTGCAQEVHWLLEGITCLDAAGGTLRIVPANGGSGASALYRSQRGVLVIAKVVTP